MQQSLLLIVSFVGISVITTAVLMLVRDLVRRKRGNVDQRLVDPAKASLPPPATVLELPDWKPGLTGAIDRWFGRVVSETGLGISAETAFLAAVSVGLVAGGALFILRDSPIAGIAGLEMGMLVVIGFLMFRRAKRRSEIQEQLPDVMELLSRSMRAGESIDQAIHMVGESAPQPLGNEFKRCARQLEMGLGVDVAVRSMARRVPLAEMRILAATISVQRNSGGNLAVVLERLVRVVRDRIAYHRQFKATTAAGRVSSMIIAAAGPMIAFIMFTWHWEYIRKFVEQPTGQALISVSIVLQVIGLAWIYKILNSDY